MYGWIWLAAIVVFLALEAGTSALVSIWFAGGALAALLAMLLGASFTVQFLVFLIVSVGCVILLRQIAVKNFGGKKVRTNLDRIVGENVIITETVDNTKNSGTAKINDVVWRVKSENGEIIAEGETAAVTDIDGVKLIVRKELV